MRVSKKRQDRGVQFIRSNLELLGFGNRRDALVQAVKELFENALDATQALSSEILWDHAPLEFLRISVKLNATTGNIDIVCADTGSGIHAHQVKLLCCNAFETTKNGKGGGTSGKYGVGLKAAMLYSQMHLSEACLKITTTSKSNEILYVQLRIDPDSEETAIVKKVAHFVIDEEHQHFSGTEMRLFIPCPQSQSAIESAADMLALYFQSLRYTAPPFVRVHFTFDVGETCTSVDCQHKKEPLDRFAEDLGVSVDDVLYAIHEEDSVSISCVALMFGDMDPIIRNNIEICLLRFANHTPLINGEDIFLCGIAKGITSSQVWKRYGLRCQRTSSHLVNQYIASPLRAPTGRNIDHLDHPIRFVLAVDVCIAGDVSSSSIRHGNLKKSTLDVCYADGVRTCCQFILRQLAKAGRLSTPQQQQDRNLVENFAPLIAQSLAAIVKQSRMDEMDCNGESLYRGSKNDQHDKEVILKGLQDILRN
ncbi:dna topoisomerase vi subunit b [Plasmopara halstedii]|uniref:Dna topoisomerase vi subunit b n=1 Tax=Plasmopara halstedii TaxID=4781 RepID=A0A0P1ADA9_PLAHL|nr:dna topoisomerase vi subunit b [Plasmopara halstedii]CEG38282.1 dna topoisomerase vi subunit b [Plasmopara halstedii]|eukprot:XP_024574651.1 dna topoisomerase vi subunit b [Plasmopara halstedii]